jgi:hypothetical protein
MCPLWFPYKPPQPRPLLPLRGGEGLLVSRGCNGDHYSFTEHHCHGPSRNDHAAYWRPLHHHPPVTYSNFNSDAHFHDCCSPFVLVAGLHASSALRWRSGRAHSGVERYIGC